MNPAATVNLIAMNLLPNMMVGDLSDGCGKMTAGAPGKTYYAASVGDLQHATTRKGQESSARINEDASVSDSIGWELTNLGKLSAKRPRDAVTHLEVPDAKMLVGKRFVFMTMLHVTVLDVKVLLKAGLKADNAGAWSGSTRGRRRPRQKGAYGADRMPPGGQLARERMTRPQSTARRSAGELTVIVAACRKPLPPENSSSSAYEIQRGRFLAPPTTVLVARSHRASVPRNGQGATRGPKIVMTGFVMLRF